MANLRVPGRTSSRHLWNEHRKALEWHAQPLLLALTVKAAQENHSEQDVAFALEIESDYLMELLWGGADVELIKHEVAEGFVRYLGWPTISAKFAAGQVRWQDFFTQEGLRQALVKARARWRELKDAPQTCAILAVALCGEELMPSEDLV